MMSNGKDGDAGGQDRRQHKRYDVKLHVDVAAGGDTFLFAYVSNISEMGIFLASDDPEPVGTELKLRFNPIELGEPFEVAGEVVWINPVREGDEPQSPGMGVRFVNLDEEQREKIVQLVKTIAYLHDNWV
jgi:type IV pilus assembly protein PilZ